VHLREGGDPITGAKVSVYLDAPDVGLGELLTKYGRRYEPPKEVEGPDPKSGKALMIATVLDALGWPELPRSQPTGVFVDGSDELHDPAGTGDYINTFAKLDHEGTYTWTLRAEGVDTHGNPFDRLISVSTWAGIRVDPKMSVLNIQQVLNHPSGLPAVEVILRPQDAAGRPLGPFWDHAVVFAVKGAVFGHVWAKTAAPVRFDGTYRRVLLLDREGSAQLLVSACGTRIGPVLVQRDKRWSLRRITDREWQEPEPKRKR